MTLRTPRRALYKYVCSGCGKRRYSLVYVRAVGKACTKCARTRPENQPSLFPVHETAPL